MDNSTTEQIFCQVPIYYLDDNNQYIKDLKDFFGKNSINLETSNSISDIRKLVEQKKIKILICDLRLDEIYDGLRGNTFLKNIRKSDDDIFLGLFSSFLEDLSQDERYNLELQRIYLYDKGDFEVFLANLCIDYPAFLEQAHSEVSNPEVKIANDTISEVLSHLKGISNQKVTVPLTGIIKDYSVTELIAEVEGKTKVGLTFIKEWLTTKSLYLSIKGQQKLNDRR